MSSDPRKAYDQPLEVDTHGGEVVIMGPGPAGISLTARAAAKSARRLADAARKASQATPHPVSSASQDSASED